MTTVAEIYKYMQRMSPLSLAESYDNPGLLAGDESCNVTKALISLDITGKICREAADIGAQLIISHHPVIFRPLKAVLKTGPSSVVWSLINRSLSAICMHTNLDIANGGVNDALTEMLQLKDTAVLLTEGAFHSCKLIVFVPQDYAQKVRLAMAEAGAGSCRTYDSCAYESGGLGYFRPLDGAHPFIGENGQIETVKETRIETVCKKDNVSRVITAMKKVHPYEMPAYDILDDSALDEPYGIGRISLTEKEMPLIEFAQYVKTKLSAGGVQFCDAGKSVRKVALCSGACDTSLIEAAYSQGADTFVTGEIKHSDMLAALENGLNIVAAGHFATENIICKVLCERLSNVFPQVSFLIAQENINPAVSI